MRQTLYELTCLLYWITVETTEKNIKGFRNDFMFKLVDKLI